MQCTVLKFQNARQLFIIPAMQRQFQEKLTTCGKYPDSGSGHLEQYLRLHISYRNFPGREDVDFTLIQSNSKKVPGIPDYIF